jgi:DNA-binding transcriptional LysR family regulator
MQLRHLCYFVKIVDAGSISRAATTIHVAQPALSQQIAELEEQLGLALLQRSARGVRPTKAGEVLYREAVSILKQVEQLPGILRSSQGDIEGAISVGMSSTERTKWLLRIPATRVTRAHCISPGLSVHFRRTPDPISVHRNSQTCAPCRVDRRTVKCSVACQ